MSTSGASWKASRSASMSKRKSSRVSRNLTNSRRVSRTMAGGVRTRSRQGRAVSRRVRSDSHTSEVGTMSRSSKKGPSSSFHQLQRSTKSRISTQKSHISTHSNQSVNSANSGALARSLQTVFGEAASVNMSMNGPRSHASSNGMLELETSEQVFPAERCCVHKGVGLGFLKSLMQRLSRADFAFFTTVDSISGSADTDGYPKNIPLTKGSILRVEESELEMKEGEDELIATSARVNIDYGCLDGLKFKVDKEKIKRVDAMSLTLQMILEEIVWEETSVHNVALIDTIDDKHTSESYIFVSAGPNTKYSDLLRGLLQMARTKKKIGRTSEQPHFWIDIFCVNYHTTSAGVFFPEVLLAGEQEDEENIEQIARIQGIQEIVEVVDSCQSAAVFCDKIKDPEFMQRTISAWEVYCLVNKSKQFDLLFSLDDTFKLKTDMVDRFTPTCQAVSLVDHKKFDPWFPVMKPAIRTHVDTATLEWAVCDNLKKAFLSFVEKQLFDPNEISEASLSRKDTVALRVKMATIYKKDLRSPAEALKHLRECMQLQKKPKEKVPVMAELGAVLRETGMLDEAEKIYKELLEMMDKLIGRKQTSTAAVLFALGETMKDRGKYEDSQNYLIEALEIRRAARAKKLKTDDDKIIDASSSIVECLYALADCARQEGDFEFARNYCQQALEVQEQMYSEKSIEWKKVKTYALYAAILEVTDHLPEAEEYYKKCVDVRKESLGSNHPATAASLCSFGLFLKNQSRTKEAKQAYQEALDINERLYGNKSPQLSPIRAQLALVFQLEGEYELAEEYLVEVISNEQTSDNYIMLSDYLNNLGNLYKVMNRLEKAEQLLKESLKYVKKSVGNSHPRVGLALWNLAVLQKIRGQTNEARDSWEKAMDVYVSSLGLEHPQVQRCQAWWDEE